MPNRRDVVKTGISISALPLIGGTFASAVVEAAGARLHDVLVDERNGASQAFGRGAGANGLTVHASRGDWSQLWFAQLDREWRVHPAAIGGRDASWRAVHVRAACAAQRYAASLSCGAAPLRQRRRVAACERSGCDRGARRANDRPRRRGVGCADASDLARTIRGARRSTGPRGSDQRHRSARLATEDPEPVYAWMIAPAALAPRFVS